MITEKDLQEAIAECKGQRNPTANTCIKLAAFLTIQREMFGSAEKEIPVYSYATEPIRNTIQYDSGTEFSDVINGKTQEDVFSVLDELMDVLKATNGKLYNAVIRKLS